jgi:hypothetical protein
VLEVATPAKEDYYPFYSILLRDPFESNTAIGLPDIADVNEGVVATVRVEARGTLGKADIKVRIKIHLNETDGSISLETEEA